MKMNKQKLLNLINNELEKDGSNLVITLKELNTVVLDVSRVADSLVTEIVNDIKSKEHKRINSNEKEIIRKQLLGYPIVSQYDISKYQEDILEVDLKTAYEFVFVGFNRNEETMIKSLASRTKSNFSSETISLKNYSYLKYITEIQKNMNQLLILTIDADKKISSNAIENEIRNQYEKLTNYHYAIVIFKDGKNLTDWSTIAKIGIFMEQFKKEYNFNVFENKNKERRINEINKFLFSNEHIKMTQDIQNCVNEYYDGVSYGFQFEDLFISNNGTTKILVMQKVELDETPIMCPSCHKKIVRGNSYPRILYKSFECQNPSCPSRSKIGRGKRYDFFSAKRQTMLERNDINDLIPDNIYNEFRRDVFCETNSLIEKLILLYSWAGDNIELVNSRYKKDVYKKRKIKTSLLKSTVDTETPSLEIELLFKMISKSLVFNKPKTKPLLNKIDKTTIVNGNSSDLLPFFSEYTGLSKYDASITSPPYYNAREYSQWPNMLCYLIDMMINAKALFFNLDSKGTYIYNVGDIVGQDNVYIESNMSKRRIMLGFYSVLIFQIIGYRLINDIIWDKGEVQSKRNSTSNHISGYIKPNNSYEHCLVFKKNKNANIEKTKVIRIDTVKKINSKGENILGHTAPYPISLAELIFGYCKKNSCVIDPYLGSGTTMLACIKNRFNGVGFELNKEYYDLSKKRLKSNLKG